MRPRFIAALTLLVCALFAAAPARAQVLYGRVLDARDGWPIDAAAVAAVDSGGVVVASMFSRPNGRYELRLPRAGSFRIRVERLGYTPGLSPAVSVAVGDSMGVDLSLRAAAVALDSVEVEARRIPNFRDARARTFYQRMDRGRGRYISPERVQELNRPFTSDLLRTIPGVAFSRGLNSSGLRFGNGSRSCTPLVYIDGERFRPYPGWRLDSHVRAADVWAIEVYRYAEDIPPELPREMDTRCGAVVIWTRRA
jgi:hypothetical protein